MWERSIPILVTSWVNLDTKTHKMLAKNRSTEAKSPLVYVRLGSRKAKVQYTGLQTCWRASQACRTRNNHILSCFVADGRSTHEPWSRRRSRSYVFFVKSLQQVLLASSKEDHFSVGSLQQAWECPWLASAVALPGRAALAWVS